MLAQLLLEQVLGEERAVGTRRRRNPAAVVVPLVFLLVMTSWALIQNLRNFIEAEEWVLAPMDAIIFVLAMWLIVEAAIAMRRALAERAVPEPEVVAPDDRA